MLTNLPNFAGSYKNQNVTFSGSRQPKQIKLEEPEPNDAYIKQEQSAERKPAIKQEQRVQGPEREPIAISSEGDCGKYGFWIGMPQRFFREYRDKTTYYPVCKKNGNGKTAYMEKGGGCYKILNGLFDGDTHYLHDLLPNKTKEEQDEKYTDLENHLRKIGLKSRLICQDFPDGKKLLHLHRLH